MVVFVGFCNGRESTMTLSRASVDVAAVYVTQWRRIISWTVAKVAGRAEVVIIFTANSKFKINLKHQYQHYLPLKTENNCEPKIFHRWETNKVFLRNLILLKDTCPFDPPRKRKHADDEWGIHVNLLH